MDCAVFAWLRAVGIDWFFEIWRVFLGEKGRFWGEKGRFLGKMDEFTKVVDPDNFKNFYLTLLVL